MIICFMESYLLIWSILEIFFWKREIEREREIENVVCGMGV